jgi:dolichol-phosphate mannosyltransferase
MNQVTKTSTVVIIPTYNEALTIRRIVERTKASLSTVEVLIVDDGSPDGTGDIADELAAADPAINVMHRPAKEGLGAAYLAGFDWALDSGYGVVVEMDADGSHQPEQLPLLLGALDEADLVLGSRYIPGGEIVNWSRWRRLLSWGGNAYTRMMLGIPIRDATGGFRAFRAATLKELDLRSVASQGYCFQVDLAFRTVRSGLRVVEVPITFVEREEGQSKMAGAIVLEALVRITRWGIGHRLGRLRSLTPGGRR